MEVKTISHEEVSALRRKIGQSDKKIKNSAQEFFTIPKSGVFVEITTRNFTIDGVVRTSLGLLTQSGEFVSENTVFASSVTDELVEVKFGDNKGKFMLRQERISPELSNLANSQDKRLVALLGKSFNTSPVNGFSFKQGAFERGVFVDKANTTSKNGLLSLREPKIFYRFEVDD